MQRHLNMLERAILVGAVCDLHGLQRTPMPGGYGEGALKIAVRDASEYGLVRCRPNIWLREFDVDSPSVRMATSRAYLGLEKRGLVERAALGWSGEKTTHLAPTEAGITLVRQLLAETPEVAADGRVSTTTNR